MSWMIPSREFRLFMIACVSGIVFATPYTGWWYWGSVATFCMLALMWRHYLLKWYVDARTIEAVDEVKSVHHNTVLELLKDRFFDEGVTSEAEADALAKAALEVFKREM